MGITSIEWTDRSINPFRARDGQGHTGHYCEKISPGCANCYASTLQKRFRMPEYDLRYKDHVELFLDEKKLQEVLRRKTPTKWFWCDMTDMFLEDYPDEWIDKCFAVMALTPQHTHQILTKRPERMREYLTNASVKLRIDDAVCSIPRETWPFIHCSNAVEWPRKNLWLGVSVEDQKTADERIPVLLDTPAAKRWISAEPLLGPVTIFSYVADSMSYLNWVVVGGESGVKARDCSVEWMKAIVKQCKEFFIPVFVKQLGAKPYQPPYKTGSTGYYLPISDRKGKNFAEFPVELQVREFPG